MGDDQLVTKSFTGDTHRVSGETSVLEILVCSPTTTH